MVNSPRSLQVIEGKILRALPLYDGGFAEQIRGFFREVLINSGSEVDELRREVLDLTASVKQFDKKFLDDNSQLLSKLWGRIKGYDGSRLKDEALDRICIAVLRGDMVFDENFVDFVMDCAEHIPITPQDLDVLLRRRFVKY